jgi:hypothetical protein
MSSNTDAFFTEVGAKVGANYPPVTLAFYNKWSQFENTAAGNNPIASEWNGFGGVPWNSAGVKAYPSADAGASAIAANLRAWPEYAPILNAAATGEGFTDSGVLAGIRFWGTTSFANALAAGLVLTDEFQSPALPPYVPPPIPPAPPVTPPVPPVPPTPPIVEDETMYVIEQSDPAAGQPPAQFLLREGSCNWIPDPLTLSQIQAMLAPNAKSWPLSTAGIVALGGVLPATV